MRTMASSVAKTCPDCGTLNRIVVYTTGLTPRWRVGCSHCGAIVVDPRPAMTEQAARPAAGAEIVHLPVPVPRPAALPVPRRGTGLAPLRTADERRRRLPDRRWAARMPAAASTGTSFLAACGLVMAVLLAGQQSGPGPAGPDAAAPDSFTVAEGTETGDRAAADTAPGSEVAAAPRPGRGAGHAGSAALAAAPSGREPGSAGTVPTAFYRIAAAMVLGGRKEAYPDPMEGMASLQLAALADPEAAAAAEEGLALSTSDRREVQRRLRLAEHDPKGIDGIFGPGTRAAIAAWQEKAGLPATGFVDRRALTRLTRETEPAYREWRIAEQARRKQEQQFASAIPRPRALPVGAQGCPRLGTGQIAYGANFRCDVRGLRESLGALRQNIAGIFERGQRSGPKPVPRWPNDA